MAHCPGGKYFQSTPISNDYRNVNCTLAAMTDSRIVNAERLVALMWELQFN
jgi:hypothetical protein